MIPAKTYKLEFILHTYDASAQALRSSLAEFGDGIEITDSAEESERGSNFKVVINTLEPTLVFDLCSQFGRIRAAKINDEENNV